MEVEVEEEEGTERGTSEVPGPLSSPVELSSSSSLLSPFLVLVPAVRESERDRVRERDWDWDCLAFLVLRSSDRERRREEAEEEGLWVREEEIRSIRLAPDLLFSDPDPDPDPGPDPDPDPDPDPIGDLRARVDPNAEIEADGELVKREGIGVEEKECEREEDSLRGRKAWGHW